MIKLIFILFVFFNNTFVSFAQVTLNDFGKISINIYIPEEITEVPDIKNTLQNKLIEISNNNQLYISQINPRFVLIPYINIINKDIIAGPPLLVSLKVNLLIYIGDAITNQIFSNININLIGVGNNENKAMLNAINSIKIQNSSLNNFILEGKKNILNFYSNECEFILKESQALVNLEKYDEAIYKLSMIPEVSNECYFKSLDTLNKIYFLKIDDECKKILLEVEKDWITQSDLQSAYRIIEKVKIINPKATCYNEINTLLLKIENKLIRDEKAQWNYRLKELEINKEIHLKKIELQNEQSKRNEKYKESRERRNDYYTNLKEKRNYEIYKIELNTIREIAINHLKYKTNNFNYFNLFLK